MQPTPDTEITLTHGDWQLTVSPYGASLRGLSRRAARDTLEEVVTGYSGAAGKVGGQGDVLIPFPGRVAQGRYTFDGQSHQMELNDKEGPSAIHGFLRQVLWESEQSSDDEIIFTTALAADAHPGYPFTLAARVAYRLDDGGLTCEFALGNLGDTAAPVAAGFHPYFTIGSGLIDMDILSVPFRSYLEFDEALIPTGRVLPVDETAIDFRLAHAIEQTVLNTCYCAPQRGSDGRVRVTLTDPSVKRALTVWMDEAFEYIVLYSGDPLPESHRRRALAIEPMTCGSDAFNHPAWGLVSLAPGETFSGTWGVSAE
jgi:aldose 1-epimerase